MATAVICCTLIYECGSTEDGPMYCEETQCELVEDEPEPEPEPPDDGFLVREFHPDVFRGLTKGLASAVGKRQRKLAKKRGAKVVKARLAGKSLTPTQARAAVARLRKKRMHR